jgi:fatty acid synthase subunit beta
METAIRNIADNSPPGRGICVNLLYLNPRAMAWQVPLIRKLRSEGINIDGLTIGGGVPEPEVVIDWIDLGIRHLSFKPGSEEAIEAVLKIADEFPHFPTIVQWTGGRGGGHHSNEDFHEPILRSYDRLRQRKNIILVAGSGFGADDGTDAFPYMTGAWSEKLGFAAMPFDGILYGSRMMTVLEAHTASAAKEIIAATSGTEDCRWEETMSKSLSSRSIISVTSEMGQPIHTVSTRGMRLWAELDQEIFSLPRSEQVKALIARKDSLICRLNCDFQKVWFGVKGGIPVDLKEMTYSQVAERLLQLMFIPDSEKSTARWIHPSWQSLFSQFLQRTHTRFLGDEKPALPFVEIYEWAPTVTTSPYESLSIFLRLHPLATQRLLSEEDEESFLMLCQQRGKRPVPFIPKLDENFETYFKKDSLWQSEDLDALVDGDVERTCILHGPMAASFSKAANINRPVAEVLNGMNSGLAEMLATSFYEEDILSIPSVEFFGTSWDDGPMDTVVPLGVITDNDKDSLIYFIPPNQDIDLPPIDVWMRLMAGPLLSWRYAAVMTEQIVQGYRVCPNPLRRALMPRHGYRFKIYSPGPSEQAEVTVLDSQKRVVVRISLQAADTRVIALDLFQHLTKTEEHASMQLLFEFDPESGFAPLKEVLCGRNQRIKDFYRELWVGNSTSEDYEDKTNILLTKYIGEEFRVTRELIRKFVDAVSGTESASEISNNKVIPPIDIAIVLGWAALTKPLVSKAIDVDLSRLVHLSNSFKVVGSPLQEDDVVRSASRVTAVTHQANGKVIELLCEIIRGEEIAILITSKFLVREPTTKLGTIWETKFLPPSQVHLKTAKDVAVFLSRSFISLDQSIDSSSLLQAHVVFKLQMVTGSSNSATGPHSTQITGCVFMAKKQVSHRIGQVACKTTDANDNPVLGYLKRHSIPVEELIPLKNPIRLHASRPRIHMGTTESYSCVSGDFNPIHTSDIFASFCGLPQIIRHGMCTSAAVQAVLQQWAGGADRVEAYDVSFLSMLLPADDIEVEMYHTGMKAGRKLISVKAFSCSSGCVVLEGVAEVQERRTAFLFTGQGSQKVGMGMDLADKSAVAKDVWDRADHYFSTLFGKSYSSSQFSFLNTYQQHFSDM